MAYTTIDDPSAYFQTLLYTGNSSTRSVTNDGNSDLQPDWVWTKCRSNASDNFVFDSNRGVHKRLFTNTTAAEVSNTNALTAFNSDGFSMGNVGGMNFNNQTYVAWQWKANGGTTASNTDGTITSTVQANTTAGFSIVTYTGNESSGATIGHGLGSTPNVIIVKVRSSADAWSVYHSANTSAPETDYLVLNTTAATADLANRLNDTAPTSTLITLGNSGSVNGNGTTHVAYCFAEKQGYSKFGSYTGNGSTNGPFVYTGFKPAWIMFKSTSATGAWQIYDSTRETFNDGTQPALKADGSDAEFTKNVDILSNGVKLRDTTSDANANGVTYVYMAFAEHPFVSSEGVPTTAR